MSNEQDELDLKFRARNIVNQLGDLYSPMLSVQFRQNTNDRADEFVLERLTDLVETARKPRLVETVENLEALSEGTLFLAAGALQPFQVHETDWTRYRAFTGATYSKSWSKKFLPVTVLWSPSEGGA